MTVSYEQVSARLDPDISESVCLHIPEPGGLPVVVDGRDVGRVNVLVGVGALGRRREGRRRRSPSRCPSGLRTSDSINKGS